MPRRRRDEEEDDEQVEEEEEEQPDELERAEATLAAAKRKEKGKSSSSSSSKDKGKKKSSKDKDARRNNNASDEEIQDEDDENAGSNRKGKSKMSDKDVTEKARELVRFVICNEASKRLLKRDEINKKVLAGNTRAFAQVFSKANILLQNNFGMELVELFPRDTDETAEKPKKKNAAQNENEADNGEAASDDDAEDGDGKKKKKKKKPAAKKDSDKPKKGSAKAFCLRTTLDDEILRAAIAADTNIDNDTLNRREVDTTGSLGDAASNKLQEWKQGDDAIFDWKTGPEQRTLMGILYVILSLILVNERVLTDEQLLTHLRNINLRLESPLPLNPTALRPEKQTLNTFLSVLIKQNYLEKTKLATSSNKAQATQGGGTQRVKATQATQRSTQRGNEDNQPSIGSADEEWRWGARAYKEIGEAGIASFVKNFYKENPGADSGGVKTSAQLKKEILRGVNGGKTEPGLSNARDDDDD